MLVSLVILFFIQWSIVNPIAKLSKWMKEIRAESGHNTVPLPVEEIFSPISREAATLAKHLSVAKAAVTEEAKLRQTAEALWTAERLKEFVKGKLQGSPLFVVSNREPYMHFYQGKQIDTLVPAGGLVTALDPILRICGGTWVAHGAGDADMIVVDKDQRVKVPPDDPTYFLKRVFLTKEEENGYYYGFSNEGFWPLCHITHTRPIFREEDWAQYQKVNRKFAKAVLEELANEHGSCVLIQDYHLALLPRLLKNEREMKGRKSFPFPDRFWSEMRRADNCLLMIDYDGTIAPFQMNPALAYPFPGVIELLRKIQQLPGNLVTIISGRTLSELKKFVEIKGIHYFGSYGMEEEVDGHQECFRLSEEGKAILDQGRKEIENAGMQAYLEEKPYSMAFHIRGVKDGSRLISHVLQLWKPLEKTGFISIVPFNGGVELSVGRTKDFAILKMMAKSPAQAFAVYIGDDAPDEPAFKAVNQSGWGIKIGSRNHPTSAKLFLNNFQELSSFLKRWIVEQMRESKG